MTSQLDAIKARHEIANSQPITDLRVWDSVFDVPALVAAVEVVLAIHEEVGDAAILNCDCGCGDEPRSWESITEPGDTIQRLWLTSEPTE